MLCSRCFYEYTRGMDAETAIDEIARMSKEEHRRRVQ